jgi:hypothetical protein
MGGACSTHGKYEKCIGVKKIWSEGLKGKDHLVDLDVGGRIMYKMHLKRVWTGFFRLTVSSSGRLL